MTALAGVDAQWDDVSLPTQEWTIDLSAALYKISRWGVPYFAINALGNISVQPFGSSTLPHQEIDLLKVVKISSSGLGLQLPLIVRFPDVLKHRLESLNSAFDVAMKKNGYGSYYRGVYPVKCNQDRFVVEDIVEFGFPFGFGLEAGSKPELLLAMSCLVKGSPEAFLVCNGYKDEEYISLALMGKGLNLNTVIVLEQEEELNLVIKMSKKLGVRPFIGLRARLRTKHLGHFGSTSGEKGKFGLTTTQILSVVAKLKTREMLDCLQLLHFHIGSQIPSTALLSYGVGEAAQIYCELSRLGANMRVIDIGGGLGIDYDGSHSGSSDMSVGYYLEEYTRSVVQAIQYACDLKGIDHPIICSESGRALVSQHSILVFEVISSNTVQASSISHNLAYILHELVDEAHTGYRNVLAAAISGDYESCLILADQLKLKCIDQFKDGLLNLEHLAAVDALHDLLSTEIRRSHPIHTYNINLSIFSSIPDFWAIGQLFPIVPVHRLNQKPSIKAILSDLTCDSDGKIDKFIGDTSSIPLHNLVGNENYYLGMFLGGAYQEALGGMHNLFGGPSVVHAMHGDGACSFRVTRAVMGPSCAEALRAMQHEPGNMFEGLKRHVEDCAWNGDKNTVIRALACAFRAMPYLVFDSDNTDGGSSDDDSE